MYISDVALLGLAGLVVLHLLTRCARCIPSLTTRPLIILLLIAGWSGASALWARMPDRALEAGLRWGEATVVALAIAAGHISVQRVAWVLGLGAGTEGLTALGQFLRQGSLGLGLLGELPLSPLNPYVVRWPPPPETGVMFGYGLAPHPYLLAGYLLLGLGALWGLKWAHVPCREPVWPLATLAATLGLLTTMSRASWLAFSVAAGLATSFGGPGRFRPRRVYSAIWLTIGLSSVVALLAFSPLGSVFWSRVDRGVSEVIAAPTGEARAIKLLNPSGRPPLAGMALELLSQSPFLGVGGGNFVGAAVAQWPSFPDPLLPAHNVWLLALTELGPAGLCLATALAAAPVWGLWRWWRARDDWLVTWTALWCGYVVIWVFDYYPWEGQHGRLITATILGLWTAAWRRGVTASGGQHTD